MRSEVWISISTLDSYFEDVFSCKFTITQIDVDPVLFQTNLGSNVAISSSCCDGNGTYCVC